MSIELSNLRILTNSRRPAGKSILRKSNIFRDYIQQKCINQNNDRSLTINNNKRKVFFTHVDSYNFDPYAILPYSIIGLPQRQKFYTNKSSHIQCLCHHHTSNVSVLNNNSFTQVKLKRHFKKFNVKRRTTL
ncbi:unnamed protein product [Didymodactylos carnosus]|uniref:Uncharacterized protein n=1 Tax=Didymodactylos carnosus TaxID=1234261 RepID=A0A813PVP5_9BILA|nr:unnamed protein product [Didymodactylos carnosus]CAF3537196.1 unnamed protein product [Didymodactylos carnosus]